MIIKSHSKKIVLLGGLLFLSAIIIVITINGKQSATILINPEKVRVISKANVQRIRKLGTLEDKGLISFVQMGTVFVTGNQYGEIFAEDYSTGKSIASLDNISKIRCLATSPDGKEFAIADGRDISIWNISGKKETVLVGHKDDVNDIAFSPDGKLLASASLDNTVRIWDLITRQTLSVLADHTDWVTEVAFSPDGQQLASGSSDGTVRIWNVETKQVVKILRINSSRPLDLAYSPLGGLLAVAYDDNAIRFWSIADSKIIKEFQGGILGATIGFTPDGLIMASASSMRSPDDKLRFWNTVTGDLLLEIPFENKYGLGHLGQVKFSSDGKLLAIGMGLSGDIEFWGLP